jgi:hypothetical protein
MDRSERMRKRKRPPMRTLLAVILLGIAFGLALLGVGAVSNLWADHPDNGAGTYIAIGGGAFVLAIAALQGAIRILRGRDES